MSDTFKPTDATRAILKQLNAGIADEAEAKFFEVWESEISDPDAPRIAGSIIAHAYMRNAARFAVFGSQCADREPSLDLWLAVAKEQFDLAVQDCKTAHAVALSPQGTAEPEGE
jgi:hypothetical protein